MLAEPTEIVQRLLTAAIARVGGRDASRVGLEKIEALAAGLREAWSGGKRFSANVAGARLRSDAKGVGARRAGAGAAQIGRRLRADPARNES